MINETYLQRKEREADEFLAALLSLPMPEIRDELFDEGTFDPWRLFPSIYGSYSSEFDVAVISILEDLRDNTLNAKGLAIEIIKEMLCKSGYCDYGTSPRVCFANGSFEKRIPELIEKWKQFYFVHWDEEYDNDQ